MLSSSLESGRRLKSPNAKFSSDGVDVDELQMRRSLSSLWHWNGLLSTGNLAFHVVVMKIELIFSENLNNLLVRLQS